MRVGRAALDEDAIRLLEEYNPDVEFDWTRILKGQPEPQPQPQPPGRQEPPRRDRAPRRPDRTAEADIRPQQTAPPARPAAPVSIAGVPSEIATDEMPPPEIVGTPSAALARLGPEGLLRLRARYAEVMARISERIADAAQRDGLKSKAERLNPDAWVTDEEVRQALDAYETTFEELRAVVGRPRKRRRARGASRRAADVRSAEEGGAESSAAAAGDSDSLQSFEGAEDSSPRTVDPRLTTED